MTDRELLGLAAKAAGYIYVEHSFHQQDGLLMINFKRWNPLTDDGDALRLAVQLRISVIFRSIGCDATDGNIGMAYERFLECDTSATRRAIVRAAAEIGKAMS